jgi:ribosome maturation factor RimP
VDIVQKIEKHIGPSLELEGYDLVRIRLSGDRRKVLQIMIDRLDGKLITLEDCESVSRLSSILLDQIDPLADAYSLEVSSPGLDRPLTKPAHFGKAIGQKIAVITNFLIKNRKRFSGILEKVDERAITLCVDHSLADESTHVSLDFSDINSAKIKIDF